MIKCQKVDDFRATTKVLAANKIPHYSYQLKEDKKQHFLLRGLPVDSPPELIAHELKSKGINTDHVHQLYSSRPTPDENRKRNLMRQNDPEANLPPIPLRPLPMFQVRLDRPEQKASLTKITHMLGLSTKVEPYHSAPGPIQCRRCQAFGHTHKACALSIKCFKCAGPHHHSECKKPKDQPGICANCKGDHISTYRGCPKYKELALMLRLKHSPPADTATAPALTETNFPPPPVANVWKNRLNANRTATTPTADPPSQTTGPTPSTTQSTMPSNSQPRRHPQPPQNSQPTKAPNVNHDSWKSQLKAWLSGFIKKVINPEQGKTRMDVLIEEVISGAMIILNGL